MEFPIEPHTYYDSEHKVWSGNFLECPYPENHSIGQVVLKALEATPDKVIQICDATGERLTCKELISLSKRLALNLVHKIGLVQEDVLGLMMANTTNMAPITLASFLIGTAMSPIHDTLEKATVVHVYGSTRPKIVFCDEHAYDTLVAGLNEIQLKCKIYIVKGHVDGIPNVNELLQSLPYQPEFTAATLKKGGDQTALILCSSGTTGYPKGVCISHRNILARSFSLGNYSDGVLMTFSSLYWVSGFLCLTKAYLSSSLRIITSKPFTPELFLEIIEKYGVTEVISAPSHACMIISSPDLLKRDLSSIKNYFCGGSFVPISVAQKMGEHIKNDGFIEVYGLTEIGGIGTVNVKPRKKLGTVGQLVSNVKAIIIDDDGTRLGVGQKGELCFWTPYKWGGYYGNPQQTNETIDGEGWIKTGDLGCFDEEGFLTISGRRKDIMKYKNFQIAPIEIEEIIQKMPGVVEVCVFGLPDLVATDLPTAVIIKSTDSNLTAEDVHNAVSKQLPKAKHLHGGVYFVKQLPKTPSGKVQRRFLADLVGKSVKQ